MSGDPVDRIAELVGRYVERVEGYTDIVVDAARRNAAGTYDADQLLDTVQGLTERAVRDAAEAAAYLLDAFFAAVPGPEPAPAPPPE